MTKAGVYQIRNLKNNKLYIGSTQALRRRWGEHKRALTSDSHHSIKLQRAWNKHESNAFIFEILLYCDPEDCLMYEQIALDYYKPEYNIALIAMAPMTGKKHTESAKAKIRCNRHTKDAKKRIGMAQTKEKNSQWGRRGRLSPYYGKSRSLEVKAKISLAQRGDRGNNSKLTAKQVGKIRQAIDGGQSITEVADDYSVSPSTIYDIRSGRTWNV